METFLYTVIPALYQAEGGPEAQVGDQVKLYLDTDAQPGFPEFILGVIQHPIVRVCDGTQYAIEYDPADLEGAAELLVTGDVISALVVTQVSLLEDRVAVAEEILAGAVFHDGQEPSANDLAKYNDDAALGATEFIAVGNGTVPADNPATARLTPAGLTLRAEGEGNYRQIIPTNVPIAQNYGVQVPARDGVLCVTATNDGIPDALKATTPVTFPVYTVATLPTASAWPYARAFVSDCVQSLATDAGSAGFTGGGGNKTPVFSDGAVWIIG